MFHQLTFISMMDTIKFVKNCCKTYYNYNNKVLLLTTFEQGVEFVSLQIVLLCLSKKYYRWQFKNLNSSFCSIQQNTKNIIYFTSFRKTNRPSIIVNGGSPFLPISICIKPYDEMRPIFKADYHMKQHSLFMTLLTIGYFPIWILYYTEKKT